MYQIQSLTDDALIITHGARLVKGSNLDLIITMKSFYGQTYKQQDAEIARHWDNLTAQADKQRRLQKCWEQYINGEVPSPLFVDRPRQTQAAIAWAYRPVFERGDDTRRQWLEAPGWETGVFAEHRVIVFPRIQYDEAGNTLDVAGLTLFDLDERGFGESGADSVELDRRGNLIIEGDLPDPARPLNVPLLHFLEGLDYLIAHNGKTPQEVAATRRRVKERAQQFRAERLQKEMNKR